MSRTIAVHVRYNVLYISLYISLLSSINHQREVLRILENVGLDGKCFGFPYEIDRWHYIFSLSRFLDKFVLWGAFLEAPGNYRAC